MRYRNTLSSQEIHDVALAYKKLYLEQLQTLLSEDHWQKPLSSFDPSDLSFLEERLTLSFNEKLAFDYFKALAPHAVESASNEDEFPPVSVGRFFLIKLLPIGERLDVIVGTNSNSKVQNFKIHQGYDDSSQSVKSAIANTLSDHHFITADLCLRSNKHFDPTLSESLPQRNNE